VPSLMPETSAPLVLADCFGEQESFPRAFARMHGDNLKFPQRQRALLPFECRRAFPYVIEAMTLGVIVKLGVVGEYFLMHQALPWQFKSIKVLIGY